MSSGINEELTHPLEQRTWFNSKGPDAPIAWYGGKHYLARWIIEQMPDHRVYDEPFGGMAGVLLKKEPSEVEVFNDLDGRAVNFFRVIRDRERVIVKSCGRGRELGGDFGEDDAVLELGVFGDFDEVHCSVEGSPVV